MSDLHQTFSISPISSDNMKYGVNDDPILQDSSQEPSTSSKSPNYPFSVKSCLILIKLSGYLSCHLTTWSIMLKMIPSSKSPLRNHQHPPSPKLTLQIISDLDQTFRISCISSNNIIYNVKDDPILQVSSQEHQHLPSPQLTLFQSNHIRSWSKFQDIFHII